MKNNFYLRLALGNIRKNGKFYIPFLLTCAADSALFFDMCSIYLNDTLVYDRDVRLILKLGLIVIGIFSVIFLFYTNSFLIKRRQKELALYNIFGMEKRHIARMLAWETLLSALISVGAGIVLGIILDRLMFLIILRLLHLELIEYSLHPQPVLTTLALFGAIFVLILVSGIARIQKSRPAELLRGASEGEREPKSRLLLAILGAIFLASGYGLAISQKGLSAFTMFFVAVLLVILGTYCLFTAGTISVLKLMRRSKSFYYQPNHFISVSGMIYRMKQNAVGLANICILSTIVLVLLSSTVSMYAGMTNILNNRFAFDVQGRSCFEEDPAAAAAVAAQTRDDVYSLAEQMNLEISGYASYEELNVTFRKDGDDFVTDGMTDASLEDVAVLIFLPAKSYLNLTGRQTQLADDEVLIYNGASMKKEDRFSEGDTFRVMGREYRVEESLDEPPLPENTYATDRFYYIVLSGDEALAAVDRAQRAAYTENYSTVSNKFHFDLSGTKEEETAFNDALREKILAASDSQESSENPENSENAESPGGTASDGAESPETGSYPIQYVESRAAHEDSFYGMYGAFLFIRVFLGALFIAATVLIIYYKQIIEGYEDKERFEIMKKVGLSRREIKSAVKSQILTMFFLPLAMAVIHLAFAFPMVKRILSLLNLTDVSLFTVCTLIIVCVFAVCYAAVYAVTAKAYYKIVS